MIIALGHRQSVGKNACGRLLKESDAFERVELLSFAYEMKLKCFELFKDFGLQPPIHYEANRVDKNQILPMLHKSPRQVYIEYGMAMRSIYENIWIHHAMKQCQDKDTLYVFTDLRFPNEFRAVKNKGGYCIRVDNPNVEVFSDEADDALAPLAIGEWDAIVYNCSDLLDLSKKIHQTVEGLS